MKNSIVQLSTVLFAFAALTFLVSYTRPGADEAKQYMVIREANGVMNPEKFVSEVNQKMSEGWKLQGGVSINQNSYAQALVK